MTLSTLAQTTIEHLGSEATEADLANYRAAVERVMESVQFDRDEERAMDFVWNNGAILFDAGSCIYCEGVAADITIVPAADDDDGWAELSTEHLDDCEWFVTRSHRLV